MNQTKKIFIKHGVIELLYLFPLIHHAVSAASHHSRYNEWRMLIPLWILFLLAIHSGIAIILAMICFIRGAKEQGNAHLLSVVFILIIGIPACCVTATL